MCGIAGIFAYAPQAQPPQASELALISNYQRRRGPDDHATWHSDDGRCLFDHRRLAIIDLSPGGRQPMVSADGAIAITFNGEIYNYQELRRQLQNQGCVFRSSSDTEVILQLYERMGEEAIAKLRGMFALAIWDGRRGGVLLARDPFGIKPLYYADDGGTLRFASLAKALLAGGAVADAVDPAAQVGFLMLGSVPEPFSWWHAIRPLPAGCTMWIDRNGLRKPNRCVDLSQLLSAANHQSEGFLADFGESVACHMLGDVPVGVFLSSGIDSVAIAERASRLSGQRLTTLTVGFDVYRDTVEDETRIAASAAQLMGSNHLQENIGLGDFRDHRETVLASMDQPTIDGVNTYFVSLAAKRAGLKVALSGIGGDELLGGYPSFGQIPALVGLVSSIPGATALGAGLRRILAPAFAAVTSPKYAGLIEYGGNFADAYLLRRGLFMPWEIGRLLDSGVVAHGLESLGATLDGARATAAGLPPYSAVAWLEITLYLRNQLLRDTDWASMAHSLEIRTPFVDIELFRRTAPQLATVGRPSKATLLDGMAPALRTLLENRAKRGFQVPIREWMRQDRLAKGRMRGWRGWALEVMEAFQAPVASRAAARTAVGL